jgi:hypothetical protein
MPIGTSKLGVLGAGLVPGGSVTFNTSGTWPIPPGVKKVSITGKGGTGNPGVAGNSGTPGNPGTGGGGGSAGNGAGFRPCSCIVNIGVGRGGAALKSPLLTGLQYACPQAPSWTPVNGPSNLSNKYTRGGSTSENFLDSAQSGCQGQSGNAGSAGNAGQPGNPGNASNALGNTFPGGAGGNAGVAGAAGNGGTGGQGGGAGGRGGAGGSAGTGGNGGGQGGSGGPANPVPQTNIKADYGGVGGGGGAGVVNSGQNGVPLQFFEPINTAPANSPLWSKQFAVAGGTGNPQVSYLPVGGSTDTNSGSGGSTRADPIAQNTPTMQGGIGGGGFTGAPPGAPPSPTRGVVCFSSSENLLSGRIAAWVLDTPGALTSAPLAPRWNQANSNGRNSIANYNNPCLRPEIIRAGGGGGGSALGSAPSSTNSVQYGGGGGGGGRGNAGNTGGSAPTPTGAAGTPQTFNCVPVTPGSSTPVTVGGPSGGQIVISWNPQ